MFYGIYEICEVIRVNNLAWLKKQKRKVMQEQDQKLKKENE